MGTHDMKCATVHGIKIPKVAAVKGREPQLGQAFVKREEGSLTVKQGSSIQFVFKTCIAGKYKLEFRYIHALHELNLRLYVNKKPTSVSFTYPRIGMWYHWGTATAEVTLNEKNEILYTTVGDVYLDKVHL